MINAGEKFTIFFFFYKIHYINSQQTRKELPKMLSYLNFCTDLLY